MQQTNCYKLNKGKTHLFLKQKRYNSFYEMVFKNHFKNKNNLKIDIKKFNNYIKIKKLKYYTKILKILIVKFLKIIH